MAKKMKRITQRNLGLMLLFLLGWTSLSASAQPTELDVIVALVNEGALPSMAKMANTAGRLQERVAELCETPSADALNLAQSAWRDAYLAWRRASPFLLGPAARMDRTIGVWPANGVVLDAAVEEVELRPMLQDAAVRGYAAAEYLLFASADVAAATTEGRCAHLRTVTDEIARRTAEAQQCWEKDVAPAFLSAGNGQPYLVPAEVLSLVFGEMLNVTERTLRNRIGAPSGYFERGAEKPENLEAWRSQSARAGLQATLEGLRQTLSGGGRASLTTLIATKDGLVERKDPALAADLIRQLDQIEQTLAALGGVELRLAVDVRNKPTTLKRLYAQFQTLQDQLVEASLVLELDVHQGLLRRAP